MNIHALCIGAELLTGHTLNTNLLFLGRALEEAGYRIQREACVPDERTAIAAALRQELEQADVVITIGGLGPTSDDITRPTVAEVLGMPLRFEPGVLARIQEYLQRRNIQVPPAALRVQAMVPEGAQALPNRNGTAPGLWCPVIPAPGNRNEKVVVMLPGPPREFRPMFSQSVLPRLRAMAPPERLCRVIPVCGLPESAVAERTENLLRKFPEITPAYCAKPAEVSLRLIAPTEAADQLEAAESAIRREFGDAALPPGVHTLPEAVGALLVQRRWRLATAESCTGGAVAAAVTGVPGASRYFAGAIVAYSNEWKERRLGVAPETLAEHGAVSEETAAEMARGAATQNEVETAVSVTGIAGPGGGAPGKPVGTVCFATWVRGDLRTARFRFPGARENVRLRSVTVALNLLRRHILDR